MKPLLIMRQLAVGPWQTNTYVLVCPSSRESALIDPGAEPDQLQALLHGSHPVALLLTHSHIDHTAALKDMRARLRVPVMAHSNFTKAPIDRKLDDGESIMVGHHRLRVYHTPGHTPDQVCLGLEGDSRIVVGDTLFEGGPGKTGSPENFRTTLATLRRVVLAWPEDTHCYPGHGHSFRLKSIRLRIEAFLDKDHGEFCGDATWEM